MVKCKPCQQNKCHGEYAFVCADRQHCSCVCQEGAWGKIGKAASIVGGLAVVSAGVAGTIVTGGALAVVIGGVAVGGGSSLVTNPVFKIMSGEQMDARDLGKDFVVGAVVGVASGGLGAGGSAIAKTTTGAAKVAIQLTSGSVAGAAGGALAETANAVISGDKLDASAIGKASLIGAAGGLVGGASSKVAGSVSKGVSNGVTKATVRVVTQTAAGAACATGVEAYDAGGIQNMTVENWKKVGASAVTQAVVASTQECARNAAVRSQAFEDRMGKTQLNTLDDKVAAEEREKVRKTNTLPKEILQKESELTKTRAEKSELLGRRESLASDNLRDRQVLNERLGEVTKNEKQLAKDIKKANQKLTKALATTMVGENKDIHFLRGEMSGKVAVDHPNTGFLDDNNNRGMGRSVFADKGNGQYDYVGRTDDHDYKDLRKYGKYGCQPAFDAVMREEMKRKHDDDDGEDERKTK